MYEKEILNLYNQRIPNFITDSPGRDKFFDSRRGVLDELYRTNRKNPFLIALLFTEENFRPFNKRIIEYFAFCFLRLFKCKKAQSVSIGISQNQYKLWREYFGQNKLKLSIQNLENYKINYDILLWRLGNVDFENHVEFSCAIAKHVGETRYFYFCSVRNATSRIIIHFKNRFHCAEFEVRWLDL